MITRYHSLLAHTLAGTNCSADDGSPFRRTGESVFRMAFAYESDGASFLSRGDPVNALAAFLYGLGWLHCGIAAGLLTYHDGQPGCPFGSPCERIPAPHHQKLDEKTRRYAHLLTTALTSISPAPEAGTPIHAFALQVRFIAELYLLRGNNLTLAGNPEDGLVSFSYGHGWIDAGVQTGLFSISAHREIFTVD